MRVMLTRVLPDLLVGEILIISISPNPCTKCLWVRHSLNMRTLKTILLTRSLVA